MIVMYTGLPGAGKTRSLARTAIDVLYRNQRYFRRTGKVRQLWTNLAFSEKAIDEFPEQIYNWIGTEQLLPLRNVDVLWDEMAVHLDSTQWANMSLELKRWLQQHRKFGIEIYGTAQDFAQVDVSARRLISDLVFVRKLFGSRDISATIPPPKWIWGVATKTYLDPQNFEKDKDRFAGIPWPEFYGRAEVETFDTTQEVPVGEYPRLRHIERKCELHGRSCDHVKISHV